VPLGPWCAHPLQDCFGQIHAPVGPIAPTSSVPVSLNRCVVGWLPDAYVRPAFLRGVVSLQDEVPYQLVRNGGGIPRLSTVPGCN